MEGEEGGGRGGVVVFEGVLRLVGCRSRGEGQPGCCDGEGETGVGGFHGEVGSTFGKNSWARCAVKVQVWNWMLLRKRRPGLLGCYPSTTTITRCRCPKPEYVPDTSPPTSSPITNE